MMTTCRRKPDSPLVNFSKHRHRNSYTHTLQADLAMKRLGPSTCFPFTIPAPADPAPCPFFAALSYL